MRRRVLLSISLPALAFAACGDNMAAPAPDAAPPGPPDAAVFPMAPHPAAPQLISAGGPVLTAPRVQPIFFAADDPQKADAETFLGQLATSAFWTATTQEYGVGKLTVLPTIVSTDPAPTADADLATYVATMSDGTHDGWPKNDGTTIYTFFIPAADVLTDFPGECTTWGGYHSESMGTDGNAIVYAVIPRCSVEGDMIYPLTMATGHELDEASTDPFPYSMPAYSKMDADHLAWGSTPGAEDGDLCEYLHAQDRVVGIYDVQRAWSNVAAAAGHDPCVPALSTPFQGVAAVEADTLTLTGRGMGGTPSTTMTKGITIPAGMSKTVEVDLWSDGPTGDFTVNAYDVASVFRRSTAELTFKWENGKQSGKNGDKLMLTITHAKAGRRGASEFVIFVGPDTNATAEWFGYVGN